ncbi:MAG: divalent metal cation transporter [Thermoleophilaceae bacterium]|nr:divalent metal cation transporter [Thermoleophilaceae bacterium]
MRRRSLIALAAVVGPGLLAGLSDDDPAGITTYSILGADYGYRLLWLLLLSTAALIVFHELGARMGVCTGQGLLGLVRERYGVRWAAFAMALLLVANVGTVCAEFAGVAAAGELAGVPRWIGVPLAAAGVSILVLRGSFHRVEHVLLALSLIFVSYIVSGLLAHPDWRAVGEGLVVPHLPLERQALVAAVATVGTTLAPWGLAFIQSYAADKRLRVSDLRYERVDVVVGAVMTGVIGLFVVVACAATLHASGQSIHDARDAAEALRPLAGSAASALFGLGLLGAGLLAAAVLPLSTAYSVSDALGYEAGIDDSFREARVFYLTYAVAVACGAAAVVAPGVPLVSILYLSQALNALLLVPLLVMAYGICRDRTLMGELTLGPLARVAALATIVLIAACVLALAVLTVS